jgi:hypothetical protein
MKYLRKFTILLIIFSAVFLALMIKAGGGYVSETAIPPECKLYVKEYIKPFPFSLQNELIAVDAKEGYYERIQRKNSLDNKESSESTEKT